MQIAEEWREIDVVLICLRAIRLVTRSNVAYDSLNTQFPRTGGFFLFMMNKHFENEEVLNETINSLRNLTRKRDYLHNINSRQLDILFKIHNSINHTKLKDKVYETF